MKRLIFIMALLASVSVGQSQEPTKPVMGLHKPKQSPVIPPAPIIDLEAFDNSLEQFDDTILDLNENYISNLHLDRRYLPRIVLEDAAITVRTEVMIAQETGDIVLLNPLDAFSIMLYRFTPNGTLLWKKEIDPDGEGFDLADRLLSLDISSDGNVIVVYETVYEGRNAIGVYDEQGILLLSGMNAPSAGFSPSGNYIYGSDLTWEGPELQLYETRTLKPISIVSDFSPPPPGSHYTYTYRIYDNDIIAVGLQGINGDRVVKSDLYLYDLKVQRTIYHNNLLSTNSYVEAGVASASIRGDHFACTLRDVTSYHGSVLTVDMSSGKSTVHPVDPKGSLSLSEDGQKLLMFYGHKPDHLAKIVDLTTNLAVFDGRVDFPKLGADAFTIRDSVIEYLCNRNWRYCQGSKLFELRIGGVSRLMAEGWINLKRWQRLLPVRDPVDSTKTIISILN